MPVTLTKKALPKAPVVVPTAQPNVVEVMEPEKLDLEDLVDQYGRLQDLTTAIMSDPAFAQFGLVADELKKRLCEFEPDEVVKITGKEWILEAGACAMEQRKILDVLSVLTMLGSETFAQIAKVNVSDAEKYLNPDQLSKVVSTPGFTKNRKIKVAYAGKKKSVHVVA